MADLVDNMSTAELRTKLAQYGLPVMPITASTRGLMVKKLKMVMEGKGDSKNADSRRSLAKYSSGEESDLELNKTSKEKTKNRRQTVATAMLPPVTNKLRRSMPKKADSPPRNVEQDSESESEPVKTHEEIKTVTTRRITKTFKNSGDRDEYETGSDSDVDVPSYKTAAKLDYVSSTLPASNLRRTPVDTTSIPSYSTHAVSDNLNSIRSRLGLSTNYSEKPSSYVSNSYVSPPSSYKSYKSSNVAKEEIDSPYLSSFTQRLSAIKADSSRNFLKDSDNGNGGGSHNIKPYNAYSAAYRRINDLSPDFKTAGEKNVLKNNLVSFAIVGFGFIFFLAVSFMYMGMKGDVALFIEDKNNVIPVCLEGSERNRATVDCVPAESVTKAMDLLRILHPELTNRAVSAACGQGVPQMSETDVINFIKKDYRNVDVVGRTEDLYNLHVLILANPKWGISIVTAGAQLMPFTSMDYILPRRSKGEIALAVLEPNVPLKCLLFGKLYTLVIASLFIAFIAVLAYAAHKLVRAYLEYNKNRKEQIYSMVEQIIDNVSQDNPDEGFGQAVAIKHIRDSLIPPQNRDKMAGIWDAALKFIKQNESRVRFEIKRISGEEYDVLRWVTPQGSPRNATRGAGAWQGQAFETQEGSVNNLTVSPTPCLKIRHMVDKNDKNPNKLVIQDAILEKCGPQVKILHVEIDKTSCCVYVKCASKADAGLVYQSLHGWWYEGNLITVKYLRLERYMDHFPTSPSVGPYLKPSFQ